MDIIVISKDENQNTNLPKFFIELLKATYRMFCNRNI